MIHPITQPAAIVAKQPQQTSHHHITTNQVYRDYMQTGSIYYSINGKQHPPAKVIATTKSPVSLTEIQKSAEKWTENVEKAEKKQQ
ncbi:hypothetical protein H7F10_15810 [Acidithiobacillus sp. HP-6]|uniref:hypothetical protein n=1 Tax=unclassified Acidithiobacillus TaxID=2614800 RepID=UPI00187993F2|nr:MULTISPECIES: hypothetical protein [unclassified Acidithiobacillus]MBE7564359.1 hypothetical protein [Acidithiobacillus sp. HP-6]MBE7570911.1 hypothetical protein [Acidithiobacillus sp. HP-2]